MAADSSDPFDLDRFVRAQAGVIEAARVELAAGAKRSHWMWFIFPQIAGLGRSAMARRFAIASAAEARAYLAHPVLGPRLRDMTNVATRSGVASASHLFGSPDDLKFRSCATLFAEVANDPAPFTDALRRFFAGELDPATLARLAADSTTDGP